MKYQVTETKPHAFTYKSGKKEGQEGVMYFLKLSDGDMTQEASSFKEGYKVGDWVHGNIVDSDKMDKDGNPYKNFVEYTPDQIEVNDRLEKLEDAMKKVVAKLRQKPTNELDKILTEDINPDDIPF